MVESTPNCLVLASKEVGLECFKHLLSLNENIAHVFIGSEDDKNIEALCKEHNLSYAFTTKEGLEQFAKGGQKVDWLLNFWSPFILHTPILQLAKRRLNIHPGLVPHCKGNDAAAWCIRNSLPAGVSLIEMEDDLDTGAIYSQKEVLYSSSDNGKSLHIKLIQESISLFKEEWEKIRESPHEPVNQADGGSYFTRKQTNTDRIKNADETIQLEDLILWARAHDFSPGVTSEIITKDGKKYSVRVKEILE